MTTTLKITESKQGKNTAVPHPCEEPDSLDDDVGPDPDLVPADPALPSTLCWQNNIRAPDRPGNRWRDRDSSEEVKNTQHRV